MFKELKELKKLLDLTGRKMIFERLKGVDALKEALLERRKLIVKDPKGDDRPLGDEKEDPKGDQQNSPIPNDPVGDEKK